MAAASRPASLVQGWRGAWGINVRRALAALRDEGPLSLTQVARVLRWSALHADLTSGHDLGPDHGAAMLAKAILEDAADVVTVDDQGLYRVPGDLTEYVSPYTGQTLKLLTADEQAAAKALHDLQRPVRRWAMSGAYNPFGGRWSDGRLPQRRHDPDDVIAVAQVIEAIGWPSGFRIVKDQRGVTIEGHLMADALGLLGIDPDTGTDPRSGEPYVEVRAFNNDAARLHFALLANWSSLKAPTRNAISHQVFGDQPLTVELVRDALLPLADLTPGGTPQEEPVDEAEPAPPPPVVGIASVAARRSVDDLSDGDRDMIAAVEAAGHDGKTQLDLQADLALAQNEVTPRLSRLTDNGYLVKLAEQRKRNGVYVTPQWQDGRPAARRRGRPRKALATPPAAPKPVLPPVTMYTNKPVAEMSWAEATAGVSFTKEGVGRIFASTKARAVRPVAEHIDGLIDDIWAKAPWLLPMICERIAQRPDL